MFRKRWLINAFPRRQRDTYHSTFFSWLLWSTRYPLQPQEQFYQSALGTWTTGKATWHSKGRVFILFKIYIGVHYKISCDTSKERQSYKNITMKRHIAIQLSVCSMLKEDRSQRWILPSSLLAFLLLYSIWVQILIKFSHCITS